MLSPYGKRTLTRRTSEFNMQAIFQMDAEVKKYIREIATKASASHIDTILDDLLLAIRNAAGAGASQAELVSAIRKSYTDISRNRAKAIARTETNSA